jgi:sugar phosphate isomerase/epimerase
MKLGFMTAILPELTLEEILHFAAEQGFSCVEVMCWPPGKAERRYAGVTHIDVDALDAAGIQAIHDLTQKTGVSISGLGYYPNPLSADHAESEVAVSHLKKLIRASADLGVGVVNSFIGRDPKLSVEENWSRFLQTWEPIIRLAEEHKVRVGIENCPMLFTRDEWPGGKNLATSPAIWRKMFKDLPSEAFGLNYDPSHMIWQQMDYLAPLAEFKDRLVHVHAKDARIDREALDAHGVLSYPKLWHTPKLPGQGDIQWGPFLGRLAETGYKGGVCIEVEDRAYEGDLALRKQSLIVSGRHLRQFVAG